ncbi:hypothetical protein OG320_00770 [Microbispora sp. NBC_01189]|uniref:hypothetical protein n=1 Tax=Microbispora sp. NBC_01189 TaxID=2903583 RepID=UPI002E1616C8|nr:hypothetical protein OG320_00770 [Microbispora sp. NBC_01189]
MYEVQHDPLAEHQRDALPAEAQPRYMELLAMLELAPWAGDPFKEDKPEGNMRKKVFGGCGIATYLVIEEQRLVYVVRIIWLG